MIRINKVVHDIEAIIPGHGFAFGDGSKACVPATKQAYPVDGSTPICCAKHEDNRHSLDEIQRFRFILKIKNCLVIDSSRYIIDADLNHLRHYAIDPIYSSAEWQNNQYQVGISKEIELPGNTLLINASWATEFAHFMINALGRLFDFESLGGAYTGIDHFIFPESRKYDAAFIDLLKIDRNRIIHSPGGLGEQRGVLYKAENLFLPSYPYLPDAGLIATLRNRVLGSAAPPGNRRLFLSRRNFSANGRYIVNEQELFHEVLSRYGFELYVPEDRDIFQQAQDFYNAAMIISAHGAAMVNTIFCNPAATVIEIFGSDYVYHMMRPISNIIGFKHYHHVTDKLIHSRLRPHSSNLYVDKTTMVEILKITAQ